MQSSCNIIKNTNIVTQGNKEIVTNTDNIRNRGSSDSNSNRFEIGELEEAFASETIQKAQAESEYILQSAKEKAAILEKEAYEKGYSEGLEDGSSKGYSDAYENTIKTAEQEAAEIVRKANELLFHAKQEYESYLEAKVKEITLLSINMAENVLKRELAEADGLNAIVLEVLKDSRNAKAFIIRANALHAEEIKNNVDNWRENLGLKAEFFIVADENLGPYYAIIEKNNGSVEIGLEAGMEAIKQSLL
jgi:flagellar assembly protein FliH